MTVDRAYPRVDSDSLTMRQFWNANTHYHRLVLASLPANASRVLDVGCGDGMLSRQLVEAGVRHVVGLDVDPPVLDRAQERDAGIRIEWVQGDVLTVPLDAASFDAVVSVAALHHMDAARGLSRFVQLVRSGGVVIVVGLAAHDVLDLPAAGIALAARTVLGLVHGRWIHSAPQCWPPPLTFRQMKQLGSEILPGVRYQRHWLGRYSLVWCKP